MPKKSQKINIALFVIFTVSLLLCVLSLSSSLPFTNSIAGQSSGYVVTVIGSSNNQPVYGAQIYLSYEESNDWMGPVGMTDLAGHAYFNGWEGIKVKAEYNSVSASGVFANQPQSLTITLPIAGNGNSQSQPTQQVTTYSFSLDVNPRQSGIIGVTSSNSPADAQGSYPLGSIVTLTANPVTPYRFSNYVVNGQTYAQSTLQITINGDTSVTANFETTQTPQPAQQVSLIADNLTPSIGEKVWFTLSTSPNIVGATVKFNAYVNGYADPVQSYSGPITASNGMALLESIPSGITATYGGNVVTYKAAVNGITSNDVVITINPSATASPENTPPPTSGPTETDVPIAIEIYNYNGQTYNIFKSSSTNLYYAHFGVNGLSYTPRFATIAELKTYIQATYPVSTPEPPIFIIPNDVRGYIALISGISAALSGVGLVVYNRRK